MTRIKCLLQWLCAYMLGMFSMHWWVQMDSTYKLLQNHPVKTNLALKKEIAKDLKSVHLQLSRDCGAARGNDGILLEPLQHVIERLDPEVFFSNHYSLQNKEIPMCPEKYLGSKADFNFFQKNFQIEPCNYGKPIDSQVSVILDLVNASPSSENTVNKVLEGLWTAYPKIHVLLTYAKESDVITKLSRYKEKHLSMVYVPGSLGSALNSALEKVTTPYVIISRNIVHFSNFTRFDRLLRVALKVPQAVVVSGSFRNVSGHWTSGCLQSQIKNYELKLEEGYRHSLHDCMFCDIVQGPALFHVPTAKRYKFREHIPLAFEDFFLRVKHAGYLILSCPDVMFFADLPHLPDYVPKNEWLRFAAEWRLSEITLIESKHVFSCAEVKIVCDVKVTKALMLPKCCIQQFYYAIHNFTDYLESKNILYELDSGSQFGAVKYTGYLPWDIDGDFVVDRTGYHSILEACHLPVFRDTFPLRIIQKLYEKSEGLFHLNTPDIMVEVYTKLNLSINLLPQEFHSVPTLTRLGPYWFQSKVSPAHYVRARYGPNYLKHAQSWRVINLKDSFVKSKAGNFLACPTPFFHSCLDRFPADGNLDFTL